MSHADQLLADLRAAEQAAKESYLAAVGNESVSVAAFSRLGRDYAAAMARHEGARDMMRAIIADEVKQSPTREDAANALRVAADELCSVRDAKADPHMRLSAVRSWLLRRAERTDCGIEVRDPDILGTLGLRPDTEGVKS